MKPHLPAFGSLRAFESAARHSSFTRAAQELNVSPAAISQLIRQLEDQVGGKLFVRTTRSLRLTERARSALPALREAIDRLHEAANELRGSSHRDTITVSVTPSFGSCWLLPRLADFHKKHPDISIRVDARDELVDLKRDDVDIAIRQGRGVYRGLESELLMPDLALAVCSPTLVQKGRDPVQSLTETTLLHVDWQMAVEAAPSWARWEDHHGIEGLNLSGGLRFTNEDLAVRAAISGIGVAMVTQVFVSDDLAAGRLVRFLPKAYDMPTAFHHYLVLPKLSDEKKKLVGVFRNWLLQHARSVPDTKLLP